MSISDTIRFQCPTCAVKLNAPERKAEKSFPCPNCSGDVTVPIPLASARPAATLITPMRRNTSPMPFVDATQLGQQPDHPRQQTVVVVNQARHHESQALAAIVNLLLPSCGYLVQGRLGMFFLYWLAFALFVAIGFVTLGFGFVLLPILWVVSVVDAAAYKPNRS